MPERPRDTAIAHDDGDLVQRLREQGPEIPVVIRAAQSSARVALDSMIQVRKFQRVTEEEHRSVDDFEIPVALLRVELHSESADVPLGVRGTSLACDSGESDEQRSFFANL